MTSGGDLIHRLEAELRKLRETEITALRNEVTTAHAEIAKLRRGLYGENGIYKGLSGEFDKLRREELEALKAEVKAIRELSSALKFSDEQRVRREQRWSRWAIVLVPVILGSAATAFISLLILILQTYAFGG